MEEPLQQTYSDITPAENPSSKTNIIFILVIILLIILCIGIFMLFFNKYPSSEESSFQEKISSSDIPPFKFNTSMFLSREVIESNNLTEGNSTVYIYSKLGEYGMVEESAISRASIYKFNSISEAQNLLQRNLERNKRHPYTLQILNGKEVYTSNLGDSNDFLWVHDNYLIHIIIDREKGNIPLDRGLEVRDAYLKIYS